MNQHDENARFRANSMSPPVAALFPANCDNPDGMVE